MSSNPRLDLNVLPDGYRGKRLSAKQAISLLAIVVLIALIVLLFQATSAAMSQTSRLRDEVNLLNQKVELRKTEVDRQAEMLKTVQEYQTISAKRGILSPDLEAIYSAAQQVDVQVESVSHESEDLTVSCYTSGYSSPTACYKAFDDYCVALVQTGRFSSAVHPTWKWPLTATVTIEVKTAA